MVAPTTQQINDWSLIDFTGLGFSDAALAVEITRAVDYVVDVTGQTLAAMPSGYETTAQEAIQLRVEQSTYHRQEDHVETAADNLIQSFSAGPYSEAKRDPSIDVKARLVNPWPRLHDLLWRMMTEDKRDQWREWWGQIVPAFETTEVQWDARPLYPYGPYDNLGPY